MACMSAGSWCRQAVACLGIILQTISKLRLSPLLPGLHVCRYLVKSRQAAPNTERGVVTQYEWGEAAHSEFGEGVLEGVVTQVSTRVVVGGGGGG